jgi:hypothetical protein
VIGDGSLERSVAALDAERDGGDHGGARLRRPAPAPAGLGRR